MRLLAPTLVLSLLTPALAYQNAAQVYFLPPNPIQHHSPPALNPTEANALIANHLGFDLYENLADKVEGWWDNLVKWVHGEGSLTGHGVGRGPKDSVLVVIQSNHPEDFLPKEMKQTFIIPNPPAASTFTDLIHAYIERAHQLFDSISTSFSSSSVVSSPIYKALLDAFDFVGESGKEFIDELGKIATMLEDKEVKGVSDDDEFMAMEMKSLAQVEQAHGRSSDEYALASKSVQAVLSNPALQGRNVVLIVVPPEPTTTSYAKRADSEPSQHVSTSSNKVVFSVSTCFTSNETCSDSTNSCSGHGSCNPVTIAGKTCYTCSCSVTKNDQGRRQWWAGQSCERLDLSMPFTLLAGSAIGLIVLVVFSISLLQSIGDETLPNTLTAAAAPHSKHD